MEVVVSLIFVKNKAMTTNRINEELLKRQVFNESPGINICNRFRAIYLSALRNRFGVLQSVKIALDPENNPSTKVKFPGLNHNVIDSHKSV